MNQIFINRDSIDELAFVRREKYSCCGYDNRTARHGNMFDTEHIGKKRGTRRENSRHSTIRRRSVERRRMGAKTCSISRHWRCLWSQPKLSRKWFPTVVRTTAQEKAG